MKVLLAHNSYQYSGGEDAVVAAELALLRSAGHHASTFFRDNREIREYSFWKRAMLGPRALWAWDAVRLLRQTLQRERPDVVHFHNLLPLLSPAPYYVCKDLQIPVVQTLHNYRLLCPGAALQRDGEICEQCLHHRVPWPGVVHGCYRGRMASMAVATMVTAHRLLGTWELVDCYVALSNFAARKFAAHGIPADRIVVKPNFVHPDPGPWQGRGDFALFVGRLAPEKGIRTLIETWRRLPPSIPLTVIGDGPLDSVMRTAAAELGSVRWLGATSRTTVLGTMKQARFLVLPSTCYENCPVTIAEAYACGLPVIASDSGSLAELVDDGQTGLHFRSGQSDDLAEKVAWAWLHADEMEAMGRRARKEYERKYTAGANYSALMAIYERVLCGRRIPARTSTYSDEIAMTRSVRSTAP